jgi:thymidylate synthase (FAD)
MNDSTNSVVLMGYYGGDVTHALAAWQSTGHETGLDLEMLDVERRTDVLFHETTLIKEKSPEKLLKMLAKAGHHTPFEHSLLSFQVTADIASHIHCIKHRIGVSINTESARYKELTEDKYYLPVDWNDDEQRRLEDHCTDCFDAYHECLHRLVQQGYTRKRAKESARYYLPYATQLNFGVQFNFRSFAHFVNLRMSDNAQVEIHAIAAYMLKQVRTISGNPFQYSLEAFDL